MKILGEIVRNGDHLHPRMWQALRKIDGLHILAVGRDAEFVHLMDGMHHKGSRHYVGLAADLRIWYLKQAEIPVFVEQIKNILGEHYDVLYEKDHIHIEYDPKYPSI